MSGDPKPLASLSGLLVRKGHAKPAMRPHGLASLSGPPAPSDDLGWNDMGAPSAEIPQVLVEREALREELAAAPAPEVALVKTKVSIATATRIHRETEQRTKGKAAFTLRLDQDRHLRLRLASALSNASAQTLVVAALDQFLQSLPDVEELVRQLPTGAKR